MKERAERNTTQPFGCFEIATKPSELPRIANTRKNEGARLSRLTHVFVVIAWSESP